MQEEVLACPDLPSLRIYLDSGDCDGEGLSSYEADNLCFVDTLHDALCQRGWISSAPRLSTLPFEEKEFDLWAPERSIPQGNVCMLIGRGHTHCEQAWADRIPLALRFLYAQT